MPRVARLARDSVSGDDARARVAARAQATQLFAILCKASGASEREGFHKHYCDFLSLGGSRTAITLGLMEIGRRGGVLRGEFHKHRRLLRPAVRLMLGNSGRIVAVLPARHRCHLQELRGR